MLLLGSSRPPRRASKTEGFQDTGLPRHRVSKTEVLKTDSQDSGSQERPQGPQGYGTSSSGSSLRTSLQRARPLSEKKALTRAALRQGFEIEQKIVRRLLTQRWRKRRSLWLWKEKKDQEREWERLLADRRRQKRLRLSMARSVARNEGSGCRGDIPPIHLGGELTPTPRQRGKDDPLPSVVPMGLSFSK